LNHVHSMQSCETMCAGAAHRRHTLWITSSTRKRRSIENVCTSFMYDLAQQPWHQLQFRQFDATAKRWSELLAYAIALHCHHAYTCIRIHKRRQHAENIIAERTLQEYTRVERDCAHGSLHPKGLFLARTIQHAEQVRCLQRVPWHIIDSRRYAKKAAIKVVNTHTNLYTQVVASVFENYPSDSLGSRRGKLFGSAEAAVATRRRLLLRRSQRLCYTRYEQAQRGQGNKEAKDTFGFATSTPQQQQQQQQQQTNGGKVSSSEVAIQGKARARNILVHENFNGASSNSSVKSIIEAYYNYSSVSNEINLPERGVQTFKLSTGLEKGKSDFYRIITTHNGFYWNAPGFLESEERLECYKSVDYANSILRDKGRKSNFRPCEVMHPRRSRGTGLLLLVGVCTPRSHICFLGADSTSESSRVRSSSRELFIRRAPVLRASCADFRELDSFSRSRVGKKKKPGLMKSSDERQRDNGGAVMYLKRLMYSMILFENFHESYSRYKGHDSVARLCKTLQN
ncbi:unnamed protein product, partial [Trichogramma brassicae]